MSNFHLHLSWVTLGFIGSAAIGIAISYGDLYLFHIMMGAMLLISFIKLKEAGFKVLIAPIQNIYSLFLILFLIWYSISLLWAPDMGMGTKYLFYIFCGVVISFSIVFFANKQEKIKSVFTILSVIFALDMGFAILESFSNFRLPISPYSNLHTFFGKESVDFFAFDNPLVYSDFRPPTGFHWNTNTLAITMILVLPFFLCSQKIWIKFVGGSAITVITVFAASRAVFIGLIFILCLYLIFVKKQIGTLSLIWITVVALFWGMQILSESDNPRINEVANSMEAVGLYLSGDIDIGGSLTWRRELVDNGIDLFLQSNGLGVGAGGSAVLQEKMGGVAGRFTSMHNFWVEILVEGGLLIAVLFILWYSGLLLKLWHVAKNKKEPFVKYLSQSLFLSMLGFLPAAIAASSTIYFFPMWIMFGLSIATVLLGEQRSIRLSR